MTQYNGRVRVKKLIPVPGWVEPGARKYMGYRVEVISPAHRKGEIIELALRPDEDAFRPDYDSGDEFRMVLP